MPLAGETDERTTGRQPNRAHETILVSGGAVHEYTGCDPTTTVLDANAKSGTRNPSSRSLRGSAPAPVGI
jgi:hypothetical protein